MTATEDAPPGLKTPDEWLPVAAAFTKALQAPRMSTPITTRNDVIVQIIHDKRYHLAEDDECKHVRFDPLAGKIEFLPECTHDAKDCKILTRDKEGNPDPQPCDHYVHLPLAWFQPTTVDVYLNVVRIPGMTELLDESSEQAVRSAANGQFTPDANVINKTFGALIHEGGHSIWSLHIAEDWYQGLKETKKGDKYPGKLLVDTMVKLEEIRVESKQASRDRVFRSMMRNSASMLLPTQKDLDELAVTGILNPLAVSFQCCLVLGRADHGILMKREVKALRGLAEDILGPDRVAEMRKIWRAYARLKNEQMEDKAADLARQWLDLFPPNEDGIALPGLPMMMGEAVSETTERAEKWSSDTNEQHAPDETADPQTEAEKAFGKTESTPTGEAPADEVEDEDKRENRSHGYSEGPYGNKHRRPPTDKEQRLARELIELLRRISLRAIQHRKIRSEAPPGRLNARAAMARDAARTMGFASEAKPWSHDRRRHTENPKITVGVADDVSGSMSWATEFLATMSWVFGFAINAMAGSFASVGFGQRVDSIRKPTESFDHVNVRDASDGHEKFNEGVAALDGVLRLSDRSNGYRVLIVISDGMYGQPGQMEAAAKWVRKLRNSGCIVIWITPYGHKTNRGFPCCPKGARQIVVNTGSVEKDMSQLLARVTEEIAAGFREAA